MIERRCHLKVKGYKVITTSLMLKEAHTLNRKVLLFSARKDPSSKRSLLLVQMGALLVGKGVRVLLVRKGAFEMGPSLFERGPLSSKGGPP